MTEEKRFHDWIKIKETVHATARVPNIREGEIWWCAMGENVGIEINGKSDTFARPILVLKKLSRYGFLGVPLTSQHHEGNWYASFVFKEKTEYAALAQIRVLSVSRLYTKMGMSPNSDMSLVKNAFHELYK